MVLGRDITDHNYTDITLKLKKTKMKQGNPTKRFGFVALLSAMIGGFTRRPDGVTTQELQQRRSHVLINVGRAPIPNRLPNQRQRRKLAAQTR